jgi:hypothetical protein
MYGGGPKRRGGGVRSIEMRCCPSAAGDGRRTATHINGTATGATNEAVFVSAACPSDRGPDCRQQSEALSFIGQWSWPFLQQAIC